VLNSKEAGDQNVLVFEGLNAALEYVEKPNSRFAPSRRAGRDIVLA